MEKEVRQQPAQRKVRGRIAIEWAFFGYNAEPKSKCPMNEMQNWILRGCEVNDSEVLKLAQALQWCGESSLVREGPRLGPWKLAGGCWALACTT